MCPPYPTGRASPGEETLSRVTPPRVHALNHMNERGNDSGFGSVTDEPQHGFTPGVV